MWACYRMGCWARSHLVMMTVSRVQHQGGRCHQDGRRAGAARPCFAAGGKYVSVLASGLPGLSERSIVRNTRDRTQWLLELRKLGHGRRDDRGAPVPSGGPGCGAAK